MPDRIVRDELLRSHRYRTLSSDTSRLLFVHLLLTVDSLGNTEATSTAIGDVMRRPMDDATTAKLLGELADADLIRTYQVDGKPYLHIPRFRQRLRYLSGKHPRPPSEIECKEINGKLTKVSPPPDRSKTKDRPQSAEVKRSEVKRSEVIQTPRARDESPVDNSEPRNETQKPETLTQALTPLLEKMTGTKTTPQKALSREDQLEYVRRNAEK